MRSLRRRIFVGCQGDSERSYATLLHRLVEESHRLHIDAVPLYPGAGDPLETVLKAIKQIQRKQNQFGRYSFKAVLLDEDQMGIAPDRDNQCAPLAARNQIHLIWQRPCHEGLLLRHFSSCRTHQPATASDALYRLRRIWPEYEKATPADQLARRIDYDAVCQTCAVEDELREFLEKIGFTPKPKTKKR